MTSKIPPKSNGPDDEPVKRLHERFEIPARFLRTMDHGCQGNYSPIVPTLNISALAREMKSSRCYLSRVFGGYVTPETKLLRKLRDVLGAESMDQVDRWIMELREKRKKLEGK